MLCKGKPAEVTKVFNINEDIEFTHDKAMETIKNLKEISKTLQTVKNYEKYFIVPEFCDEEPELSEKNREDGLMPYHVPLSYNMRLAEESLAKKYSDEIDRAMFIVNDILYTEDQEDENTDEVKREKTLKHRKEAEQLTETFIPVIKKVKKLAKRLHSVNILHNDLFPRNVVVMKDGSYRLIDFDSSVVREKPKNEDERILLANEKKKEVNDFIRECLLAWDEVYYDLYETLPTA